MEKSECSSCPQMKKENAQLRKSNAELNKGYVEVVNENLKLYRLLETHNIYPYGLPDEDPS